MFDTNVYVAFIRELELFTEDRQHFSVIREQLPQLRVRYLAA